MSEEITIDEVKADLAECSAQIKNDERDGSYQGFGRFVLGIIANTGMENFGMTKTEVEEIVQVNLPDYTVEAV